MIREAEEDHDLVLLDVDNGPGYLVHDANSALYGPALLEATRRALRPNGLCVIWSAARDDALHEAMERVFGDAEATATTSTCRVARSSTGCTWRAW